MEHAKLSPAMEDYLKEIFVIEKEKRVSRVSDIGRVMNVKKASVVSAVAHLKEKGFLSHEKYGFITLTEAGKRFGLELLEKGETAALFLKNILGVDEDSAKREGSLMKHAISAATCEKMRLMLSRQARPGRNEKSRKTRVKAKRKS